MYANAEYNLENGRSTEEIRSATKLHLYTQHHHHVDGGKQTNKRMKQTKNSAHMQRMDADLHSNVLPTQVSPLVSRDDSRISYHGVWSHYKDAVQMR